MNKCVCSAANQTPTSPSAQFEPLYLNQTPPGNAALCCEPSVQQGRSTKRCMQMLTRDIGSLASELVPLQLTATLQQPVQCLQVVWQLTAAATVMHWKRKGWGTLCLWLALIAHVLLNSPAIQASAGLPLQAACTRGGAMAWQRVWDGPAGPDIVWGIIMLLHITIVLRACTASASGRLSAVVRSATMPSCSVLVLCLPPSPQAFPALGPQLSPGQGSAAQAGADDRLCR